jgi:hypothetical protein
MLNSITSTCVAWCDGGVSPVVDGMGSKMMRALVNLSYKLLCVVWRFPQIRLYVVGNHVHWENCLMVSYYQGLVGLSWCPVADW